RGRLLGVTEAPDAAQRLTGAIARLRNDPALTGRPMRERTMIGQMLDRIAAMQPAERADMAMAKASRLLVLAGRDCDDGQIIGGDGTTYAIAAIAGAQGEHLQLSAHGNDHRSDGSTLSHETMMTVSAQTGLAERHDRRTTSHVGGTARTSRESLRLSGDDGEDEVGDEDAEEDVSKTEG
ncbi:MAG: hypothetical protein KKD22_03105, partial [Alphaproteobacteria bacterium]|nr:hypothetical protein [Alphaproteobacteria bacterium]